MRLRKKNVSRVAAVAVAAVMAVSAAAPAAFAAAPVATNNVAVEAATDTAQKELTVYYQLEDGTTLGQTDTLTVGADEEFEYPATRIPEGYQANGDLTYKAKYLTDSLYIPVRKIAVAPASKTLTVYYQLEDGTTLGQTDTLTVGADEEFEYPATRIPEGYEAIGDLTYKANYLTDSLYIPVRKIAVAPASKTLTVYYQLEDGTTLGQTDTLTVGADEEFEYPATRIPEGYEAIGDLTYKANYLTDSLYIPVRKIAPASKKLTVYYQLEDGTNLGQTDSISVDADGKFEYPATSIPEGYEAIGDLTYNATYLTDSLYIPVRKTATTKVVKINFYSEAEKKQIAEPRLIVAANATSVNSSELTAPKGYELCESGDFAIRDGYVYVAVRKATTKVVKINFYSEDEEKQIEEPELTVAADATSVNSSALTAPKGYELCETGDFAIRDGYVYVPVRKATTKVVKINFYSEDEEKQIEESELTVAADATSVNSSKLTAPKGYELCETGDFAIRDGYVYVPVRKATTKVVKINFYSEDEEKQIEEPELTVAADATSVNSSALTAPKGYELCEVGDFAIRDGYVYVPVRKATTKVVKINFYSEDEEKQIEEPELTVAADATSVNSSALTAPKGYELCEVGDFAIRDGYVYVPVRKATTKVVKINFYSEDENKQIAEPELTVAADATSVNSSALTAPEGYELCEVGDFAIRDGYVYVAVRKVTTPDPVDPTPTPDPEPTPAPTVNPVTTALGVGAWLLALGGLILGFFGL